jgi:predicted O-linked N-acetylglucosamine transferase (SPINDLY family)
MSIKSNQKGIIKGRPKVVKSINPVIAQKIAAKLLNGLQAFQNEKPKEALSELEDLLRLDPNHFDALHLSGIIYGQLKETKKSIAHFKKALKINTSNANLHSNLGNALNDDEQYELAISHCDTAIKLNPMNASAYSNRAISLQKLERLEEALDDNNNAIKLNPKNYECYLNKGVILHQLKRLEVALENFDKAVEIKRDYADAFNNRGNVLKELRRLDEALLSYDKAIEIKPAYAEAHFNRGLALRELKRLDEALLSYGKAIEIKPAYAEAHFNRGIALGELKRLDEALLSYGKAIEIKPDFVEAHFNRGNVLKDLVRLVEAKNSYIKALQLNPNFIYARWALMFISIPPLFLENEEFELSREIFSKELGETSKWLIENHIENAFKGVGSTQPFYLAYQELNNRELLYKHGGVCSLIMSEWQRSNSIGFTKKHNIGKIKLGIVGEQIRNHSVWNAITKGIVTNLDKNNFEIHIFDLGSTYDKETKIAQENSTTFSKNKLTLLEWSQVIIEKELDAILFPEIGMHPLTTQLACLRLSPIQLATWGHPETTGIPTIDYYLSATLFENNNSQLAYTEQLINLPNLGCHYSRIDVTADHSIVEKLGINSDLPIFICPGTPFKYSPQNDFIFVELIKKLGDCKLVFFDRQVNWTDILEQRLKNIFNKSGLDFEKYVVFSPWLKPVEFYGLMNRADAFLDTIGFSGFNTAMQAIDCALPIVTIEGKFMRGRLASGILKRIGMTELIANSDNKYIELAVRLAKDKEYRNSLSKEITKRRDILYNDIEPVHAFESFLMEKCLLNR